MQPSPGATQSSTNRGEGIAKVGTVVSAIMASSCCWLPPLLIVFGVSGAGMIAALETYRPLLMTVTFSFLAAAFYFTYKPRRAGQAEDCRAPASQTGRRRFSMMAMNKIMLWAVTVMAVVFLFFPQTFTGLIVDAGEFTPEMQRTVFTVEGMTCPG